jgi:hypothetical protein
MTSRRPRAALLMTCPGRGSFAAAQDDRLARFLMRLHNQVSTIHCKICAGDKGCLVRGQVYNSGGNIFGPAIAAQRSRLRHLVPHFLRRTRVEICDDVAPTHSIHANTIWPQFLCHISHHAFHACLCYCDGKAAASRCRPSRCCCADEDDASPALLNHRRIGQSPVLSFNLRA